MPKDAKPNQKSLERFINIFGSKVDWYLSAAVKNKVEGAKVEARYTPIVGFPEIEDYEDHLAGKMGLSVLLHCRPPGEPDGPINYAHRAAVDIDYYQVDPAKVAADLEAIGLPPIITKSKSGGLHVHFIFDHPIPARTASDFAKRVGHALKIEGDEYDTFPMQPEVVKGSNQGSPMNLPYQGDNRLGWYQGNELTLEQFLDLCDNNRVSLETVEKLIDQLPKPNKGPTRKATPAETQEAAMLNDSDSPFFDGPPCLQKLVAMGPVETHRNDFLYNAAIFEKYRSGDGDIDVIVDRLNSYNQTHIANPLVWRQRSWDRLG